MFGLGEPQSLPFWTTSTQQAQGTNGLVSTSMLSTSATTLRTSHPIGYTEHTDLQKKYGYAHNQACAISHAEVTAGAWSNPSISLRRPSIWSTANALKQLCKSNGNNWNVFKPAENAINLQNITLTTYVHAHSNKQNRNHTANWTHVSVVLLVFYFDYMLVLSLHSKIVILCVFLE